jgi:hypothetical protein
MNTRQSWRTVAAHVKALRLRTAYAAVGAYNADQTRRWPPAPELMARPKIIALHLHTGGRMDYEGMVGAGKPIFDGLVDAKMLAGDGPAYGHERHYTQEINRRQRGVWVTVAVRA